MTNPQLKTLWEVLEIIRNWKSCNQNKAKEGNKITRIETISDWTINEEKVWYFPLSEVDQKKFSILKGDILFSHINSPVHIWKVAIAKKDYDDLFHWMNLLLLRWKPWIINPEFLFNLLNWIFHKWEREKICKKAINQASLNQKQILEIQIPIPPLEEQKKIVAYLDELNATISKLKSEYQSQLAMLDEMRNSSLDLAFWGSRERAYNLNNWKWVKFAKVCEKITDGTHQTPTYFDSWFVFLSSKNVTSGKIDWDNIKYIDEKQHIEMQKRIAPKKWDILLAKNWTTGIAAIVDRDIIFDIYVSLALLRPQKNIIDNKYLLYFVNSPSAKQQFNKRIKWVGVPNLHLKEIKDVELPLPDLETQSQIVAHLDQVHQQITMLKTQVNSQIEHCDELWQSSLEKVLTQGVNNEFN